MDSNQVTALLKNIVGKVPELKEYLSPLSLHYLEKPAVKALTDYQSIRDRLFEAISDIVESFLISNQQAGTAARLMSTALSQAYTEGADAAYIDGGGTLPLDEDTAALARGLLDAQFGYVDALFETLKALRKEGDFSPQEEATRRAEGYCQSLDILYNTVKLAGAGNQMLTFDGDDGKESCTDCQKYKRQRHRASWWISHNAVPPSRDFECRGYNCLHRLYDDSGNEFTK